MKTKLIILLIGIFVVGLVVAGNVINRDANYLNETQETTLADVGIVNWSYQDNETADMMQRCLISPSDFNLPCSSWIATYKEVCSEYNITIDYVNETIEEWYYKMDETNNSIQEAEPTLNITIILHNETRNWGCITWDRIDYTTQEKLDMLDAWEESRMKGIADVKKKRDDKANAVLVNEGVVTIGK